MKPLVLERFFLRVLAAAHAAVVVACSGGGSSNDFYAQCGSSAPGHTDVTLTELENAIAGDAGLDGGASSSIDAGEQVPGNACFALCPPSGITSGFCSVESIHGNTATLACHRDCTGRRPEGLDPACLPGTFAEMARLEAASVDAFRRLREELAAHGAPRRLLRACSRAMRDEVRHARITGALARRRGERVEAPRIEPARARSLEAMAIENAVEGCVRETWGALVATRDAQGHPDLAVRAAMKRIARDETRHAALAWEVAAWLEPRLDRGARERVRAVRTAEARSIAASTRDDAAALMGLTLWAMTPS